MIVPREEKVDLTSHRFSVTTLNKKSCEMCSFIKFFFAVMSKHLDFVCAILIDDLNKVNNPECEYF